MARKEDRPSPARRGSCSRAGRRPSFGRSLGVPRHSQPRQHSSSERLRISGSWLVMISTGSLTMGLLLMSRP